MKKTKIFTITAVLATIVTGYFGWVYFKPYIAKQNRQYPIEIN